MRKLFEISKSRASLDSSSELPVVSVSDNEDHPEELKAVSVEVVELDVASRIACYTHPYGQGADRFRLLKMRLRESWAPGKPKILLVTSPLPEDGKSTVALNLTAALAEGPRPTLLLEADLRRGSLTQRLGIRPGSGVAECLESGVSPLSVMRRIVPLNFYAMTAGTTKGNPTELLQSPNFGELLRYLGAHFEWIVIDSPPVVVLSDAIALLRHAGSLNGCASGANTG
jgi:Mrp family chromosome partitioning ATPase